MNHPIPPERDTPVPETSFIVCHDGHRGQVHIMPDGAIELTGKGIHTWYVRTGNTPGGHHMIIGRSAYEAMLDHLISHARGADGQRGVEGVGLLAENMRAPARRVHIDTTAGVWTNVAAVRWVPLANASDYPRLRYEVDPAELIATYETLEADGYRPCILVHSHLSGGNAPSPTDIRYAVNPALLHMIVDLAGKRPTPALWYITPNDAEQVRKVRFQVVDLLRQENPATDLTHGVTGA